MNIKNKKTQIILVSALLVLITVSAAYFSRGVLFKGNLTGGLGSSDAPITPSGGFKPGLEQGYTPKPPAVTCEASPNPAINGGTVTWTAKVENVVANPETDFAFKWELNEVIGEFYKDIGDKYPTETQGLHLPRNKTIKVQYSADAKSATAKPFLLVKRAWAALDEYIAGTPCTVNFVEPVLIPETVTESVTTLPSESSSTLPSPTPPTTGGTGSEAPSSGTTTALLIRDFSVNPTTISPGSGKDESANITFMLKSTVAITLKILNRRGETVKTLFDRQTMAGGTVKTVWKGDDINARTVENGVYIVKLDLLGDRSAVADTASVEVTVFASTPPVIKPSPTPPAVDFNKPIISPTFNQPVTPPAPAVPPASPAAPSVNPVTVVAESEPASFEVYPRSIVPLGNTNNTARINFSLNRDAQVVLKVLNRNGNVVKNIENKRLVAGTSHERLWSGDDNNSQILQNGLYIVKLEINGENGKYYEAMRGVYIEGMPVVAGTTPATPPVTQSGAGTENVSSLCAGFRDVLRTNPLCPAISYVKEQGVFGGYPDGTFRPSAVIKRAEAVKVILVAFKKTILTDIGRRIYRDTEAGKWYSPFLLTGKVLGITGYPDSTFRPEQQVNKVELLKMFFNIAGSDLSRVYVTARPYPDVPVDDSTAWYVRFVEFSKKYALLDASKEGLFYPAAGIKRGDVAELFYRYHLAELDKQ